MAAKINWHRYGTNLRHCHTMYRVKFEGVWLHPRVFSLNERNSRCKMVRLQALVRPNLVRPLTASHNVVVREQGQRI